jgi:Family of unknown function (DUF5719)
MSASGNGDGGARRGAERRPEHDEAAPARHRHGGSRRASPRGRPDRHSLVIRVPFVVALASALAGTVAIERAGEEPATAAPEAGPVALVAASPPAERDTSTWFCAAGTATDGGMADHTVVMLNPTDRALAATVTVFTGEVLAPAPAPGPAPTATPETGGPDVHRQESRRVDLPAGGRVALALADVVEAPLVAALVEVDGGAVAVEHQVRGEHGADLAPCATSAAPTWHLAWGSTARDARELVVLFNPFPSPATVDAVFATPDGRREPVRFQGLPVPGRSVVGIDVGHEVTRADQVSATFEVRSGRVVVERLQQFDGSLGVEGLSLAPAVAGAAGAWVFADGEASAVAPTTPPPDEVDAGAGSDREDATDDGADAVEDPEEDAQDRVASSERIVVYNPGDERAEVDVEVVPTADGAGPPVPPFSLSVRAGGYEVLDYGEHDRIVPGVAHATIVRSTGGPPVVVERATVDGAPVPTATGSQSDDGGDPAHRSEITSSSGARLAAARWLFPTVAGPAGDGGTVWFAVLNPDHDRTVEVRVTAAGAPWSPPSRDTAGDAGAVDVPPGARVTIDLDAEAAAATVAAIVDADGPVVVERTILGADGRRLAMGAGIPLAEGAVALAPQRSGGLLGAGYTP